MEAYTVLLVEDDPDVRSALRDEFRDYGCNVLEAGNVEQGLEVIRDSVVDGVVLDMRMPEDLVGGLHLLRSGLYFGIAKPSVPILVFTGYPSYDNCVAAIKSGAWGYLPKGEARKNTLQAVVLRCLAMIDEAKHPVEPIDPDWLRTNYTELVNRFGGKRIAVLATEVAKAQGLADGEEIGGRVVLADESFQKLRDKLLSHPAARDSLPFIALLPEKEPR